MKRREFIKGIAVAGAIGVAPLLALAKIAPGSSIDPSRMEMYECCGLTAFPAMNSSGSYLARTVVFPIIRESGSWLTYGYHSDLRHHFAMRDEYLVRLHHDAKARFAAALRNGTPIVERGDGDDGLMPENGQIVRFTKGRN